MLPERNSSTQDLDRYPRGVPVEALSRGLLTCEHGAEVGTAGRQDHPVGWYFNASCHQLDITQYLFAET